jgi:hypothetical protein
MNQKQIDFALITSNSLMGKIPSWESYQSMSEDQYLDLIDYSKELIASDADHRITFLVIAEGVDAVEEQEEEEKTELVSQKEQLENEKLEQSKLKESLRNKSRSILNSIYGI